MPYLITIFLSLFLLLNIAWGDSINDDQAELARKALPYAKISNAVYENEEEVKMPDKGVKYIRANDLTIKLTGYHASTYNKMIIEDNKCYLSNEVVIVFQGTDNWFSPDALENLKGLIGRTPQDDLARAYVKYVKANVNEGSSIILTGHSMGGRLAQIAAAYYSLPAYTFNAAPVANRLTEIMIKNGNYNDSNINNIVIKGDPLDNFIRYGPLKDITRKIGNTFIYDAGDNVEDKHNILTVVNQLESLCCEKTSNTDTTRQSPESNEWVSDASTDSYYTNKIRRIDFHNMGLSIDRFQNSHYQMPATVLFRDGIYQQNGDTVKIEKILYHDLTGDEVEEAIITIVMDSENIKANPFDEFAIIVYTITDNEIHKLVEFGSLELGIDMNYITKGAGYIKYLVDVSISNRNTLSIAVINNVIGDCKIYYRWNNKMFIVQDVSCEK